MKRFSVISRDKDVVTKRLLKLGFVKDTKKPEFVVAHGGEGTFLFAEQVYPNIPKLLIYSGSECRIVEHDFDGIFNQLKLGKFDILKYIKLEAFCKGKKLNAMNEVNVHYQLPLALRFSVVINGKKVNDFIGDGLIVSTSYGSTAYFKSITGKVFKKGIGLAFNNIVGGSKPLFLNENSRVDVKILRGPGVLAVDCNKNVINLKTGDLIKIKKSLNPINLIKLKSYSLKIDKCN